MVEFSSLYISVIGISGEIPSGYYRLVEQHGYFLVNICYRFSYRAYQHGLATIQEKET
jgi:hypothetical protein